jgi:REP element-mobilizing transposase RayT
MRASRMPKSFKGRVVLSKEGARDGWHSRGYFPHFDGQGVTQHVSFHLFDSLPQSVLGRWREELRNRPQKEAELECQKRIQAFLDSGYGCCFLRDNRLAKIVADALLKFDGQRYFLHAWCVMPNHVHTLFTPSADFEMSRILHSWKSFAAHECNKLLQRSGRFWAREPFDRYIRNERHFHNALTYMEDNPVKAGLCEKPETGCGVAPESGLVNLGTHASGRAFSR